MFHRIKRFRPRHLALMATGAVMTVAVTGTAMAITEANFTYTTTQTGYVSIHPADVVPDSAETTNNYIISADNSSVGYYDAAPPGCFNTGVDLPDGARIKSLDTWYLSDVDSNPTVALYRNNLSTDANVALVSGAIDDDTLLRKKDTRVVPSDLREVQNKVYSYSLSICLGLDSYFEGARITYTYTSAGD